LPGTINAELIAPEKLTVTINEKVELKLKLVYGDGSIVSDADVNAVLNGVNIPLTGDGNGLFVGHYTFSDVDLESAVLVVSVTDALGNKGSTAFEFTVLVPLDLFNAAIAIILLGVALLGIYGLKKTHKLSKLLHRAGSITLSTKKNVLQKSISKEKNQIASLEKKISAQEMDLIKVKKEIDIERRKQALAVKRLPAESKYAAHKTAVGLMAKVNRVLGRGPSSEKLAVEKRLREIDVDVDRHKEMIRNLESEYCKQNIKEDFFRQKLFDYREKIHLLELEKKKIE